MNYLSIFLSVFLLTMLLAWVLAQSLLGRVLSTITVSFATIGFWLSLIASYHPSVTANTVYDPLQPIATGGFPIAALHYPPPPMGSDYPPLESWPLFFLNYGIWLIGVIVICAVLMKFYPQLKLPKFSAQIFALLNGIATVVGCFYLLLRFD